MWPFSSRQLRTRNTTSRRRNSVRLSVEDLERRDTPAVFTVTSAADNLSTVNPTTVPLTQQGDLTLRQAIIDANATPGTNTVNFAIPPLGQGDPTGQQGNSTVQTITLLAPLPTLSNPTIVDGTSQAGWTPGEPAIAIDGGLLTSENEMAVSSNGCVIQGLNFTNSLGLAPHATGLALYSNGNGVYDDTFFGLNSGVLVSGGASNNTIGGPAATQGNSISFGIVGIALQGVGTSNNVVQGDVIQNVGTGILASGVDTTIGGTALGAGNVIANVSTGIVLGVASQGPSQQATTNDVVEGNVISRASQYGIIVRGASNTVGGTSPGAGNTISGLGTSAGYGIDLDNIGGQDRLNLIEGNTITALGVGIQVQGVANTIGGTAVGAGNNIGNNGTGISIIGSSSIVQGNLIGVTPTGQALPNATGVSVSAGAFNNLIGGTVAGAGNTIADNSAFGVDASASNSPTAAGNAIEENSIFANGTASVIGEGILPDTAVAPNSPALQANTSKKAGPTSFSQITGTLVGTPGATYRIEFFANPTVPPVGVQGQTFVGFQNVTIPATGPAAFVFSAPAVEPNVTATAIDAVGNTSPFSAPVAVPGALARSPVVPRAAGPVVSAAQSATVGRVYAQPFQAAVYDANGAPRVGVKVTFSASAAGPSGTFGGKKTVTVVTDSEGVAIAPFFTANTHAGSFAVTVRASGVGEPARIALTNLAGPAANLTVVAGKSRTVASDGVVHTPLEVRITDAFGNAVSGASVAFTIQPNAVSGAGGTFGGTASAPTVTDNHGHTTAPPLKANAQRGTFTVVASSAGLPDVTFGVTVA
jgi:hypothetical protein